MKRLSSAVFLASLSTLAQQASAESKIEINTSKVDGAFLEDIKANLNTKSAQDLIQNHSYDFSNSIVIDGITDIIDIDAYWASKKDSTNAGRKTASSYTACHSACHGSRGWR